MDGTGQQSPAGLLDCVIARSAYAVLALAVLQCFAWTVAPAMTHSAPPLDVIESYLWGKEWVVGTSKHPNMPGWVLEFSRQLTGAVGWPAYFASQLFVTATFFFVFKLGSELMDPRRALAGTLLLAGVFYFAWPTIEFNHNVAQMPFWAAVAYVIWHLRSNPRLVWWIFLGLLGAASLYAKLSSGLLVLIGVAWIIGDPLLRRQLLRPQAWVGLGFFILVSLPLFQWLWTSQGRPIFYAAERSTSSSEGPLQFLGAQVLACIGLVALASAAGLFGKKSDDTPAVPAATAIRFLSVMTVAPVITATLLSLVFGTGLKPMWGSPMFGLAGLLVIALTSERFTEAALRRLTRMVAILILVLSCGYALDTLLEARLTGTIKRPNWPQADIAQRFDRIWRDATGKPLKIVAGERWVAGLAALRGGDMASILTDGDMSLSPWVTPERLRREGALVVWELNSKVTHPPNALASLLKGRQTSVASFAVPLFPNAKPVTIGYAIVPPG